MSVKLVAIKDLDSNNVSYLTGRRRQIRHKSINMNLLFPRFYYSLILLYGFIQVLPKYTLGLMIKRLIKLLRVKIRVYLK